jgi:hypothetical protein
VSLADHDESQETLSKRAVASSPALLLETKSPT